MPAKLLILLITKMLPYARAVSAILRSVNRFTRKGRAMTLQRDIETQIKRIARDTDTIDRLMDHIERNKERGYSDPFNLPNVLMRTLKRRARRIERLESLVATQNFAAK